MNLSVTSLWTRLRQPVAALGNAAASKVVALGAAVHIAAANVWRDNFNPLRGLTMIRLVSYLEAGERGAYADLQWLYRFVEKRDATLRGGRRSLLAALTEMDWDIKTVEESLLPRGYTVAQAEEQARVLRTKYDAVKNLKAALEWLGSAEFRGYAHLEKIQGTVPAWMDGAGEPQVVELRPVEQWYWCRDGHTGMWTYNDRAASGRTRGLEVDLGRFIVREVEDPINEIAAIAFVRKQLAQKDWDGFLETFGVPSIFALLPQNVPQGKEAEYQDLADQVISNSRGTLPHGSDIKTVDGAARGGAPFRERMEALDKEIVLAITSGALTMLAQSGTGTLAGSAHQDTFMRVARALARRVTEVMQQQFDAEILERYFPGQPPLAYFEILANEEVDTGEIIDDAAKLKAAGYEVDASQLSEKTGYKVSKAAPAPAPGALPNRLPSAPVATPEPEPGAEPEDIEDDYLADSLDELLAAMHADFTPIATRLQELLASDLTEDELRAGLEQLRADLPKLAAEVGGNDETVQAWERILGAATANTLGEDEDEA